MANNIQNINTREYTLRIHQKQIQTSRSIYSVKRTTKTYRVSFDENSSLQTPRLGRDKLRIKSPTLYLVARFRS